MFDNITAIRSLQCRDHAMNLPPTVLSIQWFLGKRCNYDCSYCSPHVHDAVSPFIDLQQSLIFVERSNAWAIQNHKKIKWVFTGGEPFIDPGFFTLVETLSRSQATEQINATTNGSLPLAHYEQFSGILAGITFSIHLERSWSEIQKIINTMIALTQQNKIFISCNLMFLPGKQPEIENIVSQLNQHNVNFVLRKISPQYDNEMLIPFKSPTVSRKSIKLVAIDKQSSNKEKWNIERDQKLSDLSKFYYSQQELEYLKQTNSRPTWNNIGLWTAQAQYYEINTDLLLSAEQTTFFNWTCYIGVDSLSIEFDGKIYRGVCQSGGSIGHIKDWTGFLSSPITCDRNWCICNQDIAVRKSQNEESAKLINGQLRDTV